MKDDSLHSTITSKFGSSSRVSHNPLAMFSVIYIYIYGDNLEEGTKKKEEPNKIKLNPMHNNKLLIYRVKKLKIKL